MSDKTDLNKLKSKIKKLQDEIKSEKLKVRSLQTNEKQYWKLLDVFPEPTAIHRRGVILYINKSMQKFIKAKSKKSILGKTIYDFIHPDYVEFSKKRLKNRESSSRSNVIEEKLVLLNGEIIDVEIATMPVVYEGEPAIKAIFHNVTEHKKAKLALKDSEEKFRNLVENLNDVIFALDTDGIFTYISPVIEKITKYKLNEVLGQSLASFIYTDDLPELLKSFAHSLAGQISSEEFRVMDKDGAILHFHTSSRLIDENDRSAGLAGVLTDITAHKKAEAALQESEEKHSSFIRDFQGIAFRGTMDFKPIFFLGAVEKITGYTRHDFEEGNLRWDQVIHPDDFSKFPILYKDIYTVPNIKLDREYRIIKKDGQVCWLQERIQNVCDDSGKPVFVQGTLYDVTHKILAQKEQQDSLHYFQSMNQISEIIEQTMDIDKMIKAVVEKVLAIFHCDRAWLLYPCDPDSPTWRVPIEVTNPEYPGALEINKEFPMYPGTADVLRAALKNSEPVTYSPKTNAMSWNREHLGEKLFNIESQMDIAINLKVDKSWLFGLHQCSYAREWTEQEKRLFRDISVRLSDALSKMILYRDLKQSENRYRALFDNAGDAIFIHDTAGNLIEVNKIACDRLQYDQDDFLKLKISDIVSPKYRSSIKQRIKELKERGHYVFETEHIKKDGTVIPVEVSSRIVEHSGQRVIFAFARDISERKRSEAIVQKSHELSILFSITSILTQNLPLKKKLHNVYQRIIELFKIEVGGGIYLLDPDTGYLHLCVNIGLPDDFIEKVKIIPLKNSYAEKALKSNKPITLKDVSEDPDIPEKIRLEARRIGHRAWATIPIKSGEQSIGVMNLAHCTPERVFSLADTNLLHLICKQIAQTIENHRFVTAMLESESKYQEIFYNVTDMILITDLNAKVHTANPSFIDWIGFSKGELYFKHWYDLIKNKNDFGKKIKTIQRKGTIKNWPVTFITKEGNEILAEMDVTLVKQDNKPVELLGVIRDITEILERQRNIIRSQKMASLSLLVSGIAHEFNNLLGTIHTWATFSRKNIADQTMVKNTLNIIDNQVNRGRNIVQDLLLFSGNYQPVFRAVKISLLIEKVLDDKKEETKAKGIQIQAFYHYRGLVECDPNQLEILFNNLLNNSFDALLGRKSKKVIIRIIGQNDNVRITIFDNGRGMAERTANRIFEPFFSTKNKRGVGKGIGVGLAICYGIVENHRGLITVESQLRVGTTFFITLNKKLKQTDGLKR